MNSPINPQNPQPQNPSTQQPETTQNITTALDAILATAKGEHVPDEIIQSAKEAKLNAEKEAKKSTVPKKPKEPISTATLLKFIGALILVLFIALGSFMAYIAFNPTPGNTAFFQTIFGIDPNDITRILKQLVNISFGAITFVISVLWVINIFRAIWTPKVLKRKKFLSIIIAILLGVFLFSIITFWIIVFEKIKVIDPNNLGGDILVYDADLYANIGTDSSFRLNKTKLNNMIGPISLRYDISVNAKEVEKRYGIKIKEFEIQFDGAKCSNGQDVVKAENPKILNGIICTFDKVKNYTITGKYFYTDRVTDVDKVIDMDITPVNIVGLLKIDKEKRNKDGNKIMTIDAGDISSIGTPYWKIGNSKELIEKTFITEEITKNPVIVQLYLISGSNEKTLNSKYRVPVRQFYIAEKNNLETDGVIEFTPDISNPKKYKFAIKNLNPSNTKAITKISWKVDNLIIQNNKCWDECEYEFSNFKLWKIHATIKYANGQTVEISNVINVRQPIELSRHAAVFDNTGKHLNPKNTYDPQGKKFVIKTLPNIPTEIFLDARNVIPKNPGYQMKDVTWTIREGDKTIKLEGEKVKLQVEKTAYHTIIGEFSFVKTIDSDSEEPLYAKDIISLDLQRKNLVATIKTPEIPSDYIPIKITFDGSQSRSEYSEIKKFIWDFGEGKPPTTGDAIQIYEYHSEGTKEITLTVVDQNGEQDTSKIKIVLKDTPKILDFTQSINQIIATNGVNFRATGVNESNVSDYIWNFGDNTPVSRGYEAFHTYAKEGNYTVTLTVQFIGGTEKSIRKQVKVHTSSVQE